MGGGGETERVRCMFCSFVLSGEANPNCCFVFVACRSEPLLRGSFSFVCVFLRWFWVWWMLPTFFFRCRVGAHGVCLRAANDTRAARKTGGQWCGDGGGRKSRQAGSIFFNPGMGSAGGVFDGPNSSGMCWKGTSSGICWETKTLLGILWGNFSFFLRQVLRGEKIIGGDFSFFLGYTFFLCVEVREGGHTLTFELPVRLLSGSCRCWTRL